MSRSKEEYYWKALKFLPFLEGELPNNCRRWKFCLCIELSIRYILIVLSILFDRVPNWGKLFWVYGEPQGKFRWMRFEVPPTWVSLIRSFDRKITSLLGVSLMPYDLFGYGYYKVLIIMKIYCSFDRKITSQDS